MFLRPLFGKKKLKTPVDLSEIGTDMHSHLVPGVDDGVKSIEESLAAIRKMASFGYKKLITTPHIQHDYFTNTPGNISAGLERVKEEVEREGLQIELSAAAEYLVDDGFMQKLEAGELMAFGDNYILIELSYYSPYPDLYNVIFQLQVEGYKVILAHPERYSYWYGSWEKFTGLKDKNVFFQCNLLSLAGAYPEPVKKIAEKLISEGLVEFAGSDLHGERHFQALESVRYEKALDNLLNSGKLLNHSL